MMTNIPLGWSCSINVLVNQRATDASHTDTILTSICNGRLDTKNAKYD